ncbi:unnamed protein product [Heligmosomoides polygyrus]|uniref:Transposase_23 domain-containing protein n=1 Tax=Heligmosomoides polygyrus TaxID=6339 RepID=A0A183G5Y2_HELPZ|nr:unnamed protein product [Heligmosomoides polygyrus]
MGPLPKRRVVRTKPFENVGIDYFGPLTVKESENESKVYGLIIIQEMSTEKLLKALRRFLLVEEYHPQPRRTMDHHSS